MGSRYGIMKASRSQLSTILEVDSRIGGVSLTCTEIEIDRLKLSDQMLRPIDEVLVTELVRSICNAGLLQPILVRRRDEGFEVVFGNHRLEACKRLGYSTITALVGNFTGDEAFLAQVAENVERNMIVNPIVEASGYKRLLQNGWSLNSIARKIGKSDSYVCQRLSMLDRLDHDILTKFANGDKRSLTASHLELISSIPDKLKQREIVSIVEKRRLSVRSLENLLNGIPFPIDVAVEETKGECFVKIPNEFATALNILPHQHLRLCIRGRKLVLENNEAKRRKNSDVTTIFGIPIVSRKV